MSKQARAKELKGVEHIVPLGRKHQKSIASERRSLGTSTVNASTVHQAPRKPLIQSKHELIEDESYSDDERALNNFVNLHPMLSLSAINQQTLSIVANAFQNCNTSAPDLPVVPKSYDDSMLRPPNKNIGERACACGDRCVVKFLADMRHGKDTELGFVCTEFLLPDERNQFLNNGTLPPRPKKCLLCARYFTTYLYHQVRSDPTFRLNLATVDVQSFANSLSTPEETTCNSPGDATDSTIDYVELTRAQRELPESASPVLTVDGYKPCASLFVDEEFLSSQAAREGKMPCFMFKPVVRFSSNHYRFEMTKNGPRCVQIGIGTTDPNSIGLNFRAAPVAKMAAPPELPRPPQTRALHCSVMD